MSVVKFQPKRKIKRTKRVTPAPTIPAKKLKVVKSTKVSRSALEYSRIKLGSRAAEQPFFVPSNNIFPNPVLPPKGQTTMAQDNELTATTSWAASQWQGANLTIWDQGLVFPGYAYLSVITQKAEYRRPSEIIATAMTRKWIKLQSTATDDDEDVDDKDVAARIKQINDELDRLKAKDVMKKLIELDGFFGRSHLYFETCDSNDRAELKMPIGNGRSELSKSKVNQKQPLRRIKAIEPVWCYPTQYNSNDPLQPNWYRPDMWFCMAKEIHASRLMCLVSREVPDMLKPAYSFGGLSLSQMMKPYVDFWLRTQQAVSDITHNFSVNALSSDLSTLMQGDELLKRMALFNATRDNQGAMLLDKESETLENISAPLGSLDHLQAQAQEHMAAACGIPLVVLFGITPSGLNATSEGEIEVFDDWVEAQQEAFLRTPLTHLIDFIQLSLFGEVDQNITFAFEPLRSLNEKELAEARKVEADTDVTLINAGVLSPLESRKRVAADPDTPYEALDVEDLPIPPESDEVDTEGENQGGGVGGEEDSFDKEE